MKYKITIPKPCHEDWSKMTTTKKGKFCLSCNKDVIDFTKLSTSDISKKVLKHKNLCGRFKENQLKKEIETVKKNNLTRVAAGLALISTISISEPILSQSNKDSIEIRDQVQYKRIIKKDKAEKFIIIKGKVKEAFGVLPGVNILLKNTTIGTETDFDGNFSIKIPNKKGKSTILVIRYLGYQTQEIDILKIKEPLIVVLKEDEAILGEVVTVGMVAVKRKPNLFRWFGNLFRKKENKR